MGPSMLETRNAHTLHIIHIQYTWTIWTIAGGVLFAAAKRSVKRQKFISKKKFPKWPKHVKTCKKCFLFCFVLFCFYIRS